MYYNYYCIILIVISIYTSIFNKQVGTARLIDGNQEEMFNRQLETQN